ncbi:MAG: hypothetical protein IPK82_21535 [Polyangiaceae bacterium]|nr:hypothetical protein [Polyangiaceae bacterium]
MVRRIDMAQEPHAPEMTLEQVAAIKAALAEAGATLANVLAAHSLTRDEWKRAETHYLEQMAQEALAGGEPNVAETFAAAFAKAQDALAPVPNLTVEEWARLRFAISVVGVEKAVAARGLSTADYLRAERHFARVFARDAAAAERYSEAFYEAESGRQKT